MTALRVLILGGTGEGRALAAACAPRADVDAVTSLAGRSGTPTLPPGEVRVGGFGGPDALATYLRAERIDAVVDATHPFATAITAAAGTATAAARVPLLVLRRPGWTAQPGDDWRRVPSLAHAAAALPPAGARVFLTTGRGGIGAFAALDRCWFLARSVLPPEPPLPRHLRVLLDRGPFTLDGERALLAEHRIDVLVTKDSGGTMAGAKLAAARERGTPVVLVDRPPAPTTAATVPDVAAALAWLTGLAAAR